FRRDDLQIAPNAHYEDDRGRVRPLTAEVLERTLTRARAGPDGRYRAVASRWLSGRGLAEWRYAGRRRDDPDDLVPHEMRREIRGLRVLHAWLNNTDASARNTLDSR